MTDTSYRVVAPPLDGAFHRSDHELPLVFSRGIGPIDAGWETDFGRYERLTPVTPIGSDAVAVTGGLPGHRPSFKAPGIDAVSVGPLPGEVDDVVAWLCSGSTVDALTLTPALEPGAAAATRSPGSEPSPRSRRAGRTR